MPSIGFLSDARFINHKTAPAHPERPDRIRAIHRAIREAGLVDSADPFPDFKGTFGLTPDTVPAGFKLLELPPPEAIDEKWLLTVHGAHHVEQVHAVSEQGGDLDPDTPVSPGSFETALLAVGGLLQCCDAVMAGQVNRAFAAIRPPGHHAEPDKAMGFCQFSNVAIACRYLQQQHRIRKVAVVDFDVHHGNGTQACFYHDPSVLFISLHQDPSTCYPGTGYETETGEGAGKGFTINLPYPPGTDDAQFMEYLDRKVVPALDKFEPEVLVISAGFDAHRDDPLAQTQLTDEAYEVMTRKLVAVADRHCRGRVVSALEGGYNLEALGRSVVRHLVGLR
ncbi:histone deacetylase family protein [Humisphaera borealis]|uniref:Histone deacetylase n=1 Tax=Humisphaera borealis TaxID=2807512 RepID=A0A7M2WS67_9BACT|nr:histone deacetylase [Humisphaera borealis]QOV88124.1 histone deacetylase [Humisphaera borealis]